ncbi:putative Sir2 family [Trypanosoma vivax]|nr:putative Sir2 family [Trypanosoma vivax]
MSRVELPFAHVVGDPTFEGLASYIKQNNIRKIFVMAGAGISVAAGIPDFRSPNTGVYSMLSRYNLESPTDAFSLSLLREQPEVFYRIMCDLDFWPGRFLPTTVHHFIKLLADEGLLLLCCTQNIDGLERACGVPDELLVEAHGSFSSASCVECRMPYDISALRQEATVGHVPHCAECGGIVKPDVVLFGEDLPASFFNAIDAIREAELLLIMGTSLQVHPFAGLAFGVAPNVPRVLFNLDRVGGSMFRFPTDDHHPLTDSRSIDGSPTDSSSDGYAQYNEPSNSTVPMYRDVFFPGDCQVSVRRLAEAMGLGERLDAAVSEARMREGGTVLN